MLGLPLITSPMTTFEKWLTRSPATYLLDTNEYSSHFCRHYGDENLQRTCVMIHRPVYSAYVHTHTHIYAFSPQYISIYILCTCVCIRAWVSNCITHRTMGVIAYPCPNTRKNMLVKEIVDAEQPPTGWENQIPKSAMMQQCVTYYICYQIIVLVSLPDSKVHGTNLGPTWVLPASGGPHIVHMNLAYWEHNTQAIWSLS